MYEYFKGVVSALKPGKVILDHQGIGYGIEVSTSLIKQLELNDEVKLFVYHHITETDNSLFGFLDEFSKEVFLLLISVSGVGPKMAIRILSFKDARDLIEAVAMKDLQVIKGVKGLGEKTSQRLIVEIQKKAEDLLLSDASVGVKEFVASGTSGDERVKKLKMREDLKSALTNLGYRETEISGYVDEILERQVQAVQSGEQDDLQFENALKEILQKVSLL